MKNLKMSFDFSDEPEIVELLRLEAATSKSTQKGIIVKALKAYFSNRSETSSLYKVAEKTFAEWDSKEDSVYDDL
jgi:hypothetical protein